MKQKLFMLLGLLLLANIVQAQAINGLENCSKDGDAIHAAKQFIDSAGEALSLPILGKLKSGFIIRHTRLMYKLETVPCWEQAVCRQTGKFTDVIVPLQGAEALYSQVRLQELGMFMVSSLEGTIQHAFLFKQGRVCYTMLPRKPDNRQRYPYYHIAVNFYNPSMVAAQEKETFKSGVSKCVSCGHPWGECLCEEMELFNACDFCGLPKRECVCGKYAVQGRSTLSRLINKEWVRQTDIKEYPFDPVKVYTQTILNSFALLRDKRPQYDSEPVSYYLSNEIDSVFDEKKVGKNTTGKYIVEKSPRKDGAGMPTYYVPSISKILKLTDTELVAIDIETDKKTGETIEFGLSGTWKCKFKE
ncbi:MAG: hypothetical protein LBM06_01560 [Prevotellaceae bacterium]|jgi:hypothetical protein|nr:hypothetical protein [Prevotellaceae bacterium]